MPGEEPSVSGRGSSIGYFAGLIALTLSAGVLTTSVVYAAYHYISSGEQIVRLLMK
jgi:hypothetical protein